MSIGIAGLITGVKILAATALFTVRPAARIGPMTGRCAMAAKSSGSKKRVSSAPTLSQTRHAEAGLRRAMSALERVIARAEGLGDPDPEHAVMHAAGLAIIEAVSSGFFPAMPELLEVIPEGDPRLIPVGSAEIRYVPFQVWKVVVRQLEDHLLEQHGDRLSNEAIDDYLAQKPLPELPLMGRMGYLKARLAWISTEASFPNNLRSDGLNL